MTKKKPQHIILRNKLLRQTKKEIDPYRRMAQAVSVSYNMEQGSEVKRALFHVAAILAQEI